MVSRRSSGSTATKSSVRAGTIVGTPYRRSALAAARWPTIPGRTRVTRTVGWVDSKPSSSRSAAALCRLYCEVGTPPVGQDSSTGASSRLGE